MKTLKKIALGLLLIIALVLIAAVFVDGKYAVEKEININKTKKEVFEYIKYLKNQDNFSVWAKMDPNMEKGFAGVDGTVGAVASWDSQVDSVGKGEQEITKIIEGERIDLELRFLKPFEATDYAYFTTETNNENTTTVKWGFKGEMPYPMNLMSLFMNMEEMVGPALQTGLENLKVVLEEMPSVKILEEEVEAKTILFIRDSSALETETIMAKMESAYAELVTFIQKNQLEMAGVPMAITNAFSMEKSSWSFDAAIPVPGIDDIEPTGRIQVGETYTGKVIKAIHVGPYESSMSTYDAIIAYIKENHLDTNGRSWEEYLNDPHKVKPGQLQTAIYFPIK